jgi:hypothetical protein
VLFDYLIVIKYFVIGDPLSFGAVQVRMTLLAITEVSGGTGMAGTKATKS